MARHIRLHLGEKAGWAGAYVVSDSLKELCVEIDGDETVIRMPPAKVAKQPEAIGSQVMASCNKYDGTHVRTYTKIGGDLWASDYTVQGSVKVVFWGDLSVRSLVGAPKPVTEQEDPGPTGTGAVVAAYCGSCEDDTLWVRYAGMKDHRPGFRCEGCGDRARWRALKDRNAEVISHGVN